MLLGRRAYGLVVAAGVGLIALFGAWMFFDWGGARPTEAVSDLGTVAAALGATGICLWTARRTAGPARKAWLLLGLAALSWGLGESVWTYDDTVQGIAVPFPSWADAGYLPLIPLAAAGFLALTPRDWPRVTRALAVVDGSLLAAAALLPAWFFVLGPVEAQGSDGALAQILALAYPLGDVALCSMAVSIMLATRRASSAPLWIVTVAFAALGIADFGFAYLTLGDAYHVGDIVDTGWFATFVLLGLAALHPEALAPAPKAPPSSTWRAAILPLVAVAGTLAFDRHVVYVTGALDALYLRGTALIVLLVAVRQALTLLDNVRLTREVRASLERQKELEGSRTQYLNAVAHDLMTPLSILDMSLDLVAQEDDPGEVERLRGMARTGLDQIQRLVGDVRDIARIEAGQLRLEMKRTEISRVATRAVEAFREPAARRGIRVDLEPVCPCDVDADEGRLAQVLFNLIGNAVKFAPEGSVIRVRLAREGALARVGVQDEGPGLSAEQIARLFQPFTQVHEDPEMRKKGSGLGLSISKAIVEGHRGRLWCESQGVGHGTTFWVDLPALPAAAGPIAPQAMSISARPHSLLP